MVRRLGNLSIGLVTIITAIAIPSDVAAKGKGKAPSAPQDRIDILGNVSTTGGPVTRVTMTQHYSRSYLYLEHAAGSLTLLDVTDPSHPSVVANPDLPANETGTILMAAGDAALVSSDAAQNAVLHTSTMSIVSFVDPAHPRTVKQFAKVTCTATDEHRGLIFIANDEGLWILHRNLAEDPEVQERYAHDVLYNH